LRFNSQTEKHELSELFEAKIRKMGNAGRNGGEYYTPRPLIRAILAVVQPRIGETIYDSALGSAGFLCESFTRLNQEANTVASRKKLQTSVSPRKLLLESCNPHTVLDCPGGVFQGGRQDGCSVLRLRLADAQGLVLPAQSWPQPGQNQSA